MDFFDNVMNKSNAIIKERLNNPFGQRQQSQSSQDQPTTVQQQDQTTATLDNNQQASVQHQASASSADNVINDARNGQAQINDDGATSTNDGQDRNSQFAAIAADAEAVAQKAAKGAQKFGTFLFSMANKAGQTVSQTAKQAKQAVENISILTEFTREQQEFIREHGGSMQAGELPWTHPDEEKSNYIKEQILSLSQDKRNFVRNPPQNSDYKFEAQKCYPIALALLKEDPNLSKMRYELVPKLVNEDTFWCNYFYRVEMLKQESDGRRAGWASSRSSSGEGPDEMTTGGAGHSISDEPPSPSYSTTAATTTSQPPTSGQKQIDDFVKQINNQQASLGETSYTNQQAIVTQEDSQQQFQSFTNFAESESDSDPRKVVAEAEDLKNKLRELNIGSFDGGQDG